MKVKPFIAYVLAKHSEKTQRDEYVMVCLWAMATAPGSRLNDNKGYTRFPQWHEYINPKKVKVINHSGDNIMKDLLNAW